MLKIDGSLARNIDFKVAILELHKKTRKKTSILKLQSVKIGGSLARNARFDAPTCLVSSLWFDCGLAVSMRGSCKTSPFRRFPSRLSVMSFSVAGAALCDITTCLITCRKSFCVAGAVLLRGFHKMRCSFRGRRKILEISVVIHFRRACSTLHTPQSTLYTSCIPRFTLYTPDSALYTLDFTLYTPASTVYTPHFTLHTLPSTLHTPHSTL